MRKYVIIKIQKSLASMPERSRAVHRSIMSVLKWASSPSSTPFATYVKQRLYQAQKTQ